MQNNTGLIILGLCIVIAAFAGAFWVDRQGIKRKNLKLRILGAALFIASCVLTKFLFFQSASKDEMCCSQVGAPTTNRQAPPRDAP